MSNLLKQLKEESDAMSQTTRNMQTTITELKNECTQLREENKLLLSKISAISLQKQTPSLQDSVAPNRLRTLLISDSLIKDIDEEKIESTKILPINDIAAATSQLEAAESPFSHVVICIGRDACEQEPYEGEQTANHIQSLVGAAKTRVPEKNIKLLTIPPRSDSVNVQANIDTLNLRLNELTQNSELDIVNNDLKFRLSDGSVNDGYLHVNGKQLSRCGIKCFLQNAGLKLKRSAKGDPTKKKGMQSRATGHERPIAQETVRRHPPPEDARQGESRNDPTSRQHRRPDPSSSFESRERMPDARSYEWEATERRHHPFRPWDYGQSWRAKNRHSNVRWVEPRNAANSW
jgi:hypothetical protein